MGADVCPAARTACKSSTPCREPFQSSRVTTGPLGPECESRVFGTREYAFEMHNVNSKFGLHDPIGVLSSAIDATSSAPPNACRARHRPSRCQPLYGMCLPSSLCDSACPASQALRSTSSRSASTPDRMRRIVLCAGGRYTPPNERAPARHRSSCDISAADSAISVELFAPASFAGSAIASTVAQACRTSSACGSPPLDSAAPCTSCGSRGHAAASPDRPSKHPRRDVPTASSLPAD